MSQARQKSWKQSMVVVVVVVVMVVVLVLRLVMEASTVEAVLVVD